MHELYPSNPASVPEGLTKPTASYRSHAWLAVAGLVLFVALYFVLTGWFAWKGCRLIASAGGKDGFERFIAGACAIFLTVFMAKAIFFVKHSHKIDDIEIKAADQPELFTFLSRLAKETGAPRPYRVFLSPRVNAAVFYDLSILNLFLPSKKNLEIGLGLVNALNLGEFKAVLAHEFGHFGQRSMAVGRWVYMAQQIAGQIIAKRDALDTFLAKLSRMDVRIAWVGWILSLIVWSLRSVMETVFHVVVLAQRALSREMEFQADLVAVSISGSDAIINALQRLTVADAAWDRAVRFAAAEAHNGRIVSDVFAAQLLVIDRLRNIWNSPSLREPPVLSPNDAPAHRVFQSELARPPRMWSTHPSNSEREENAKRSYVWAGVDARSAWELFSNAQAVKEKMSAHIVSAIVKNKETQSVPMEASLAKLAGQYDRTYLRPQYRGAYLNRSITRYAGKSPEAGDTLDSRDHIADELAQLYPESLVADLETLRQLEDEKEALQGLYEGALTAPGGIIRYRGKELHRRDLPQTVERVAEELRAVQERVHAHDRRCRASHFAAAAMLGNGWESYLRGLGDLLRYAEHAEADVLDAHGVLNHVYSRVTCSGRITESEVYLLLNTCTALYVTLKRVYETKGDITLDAVLTQSLEVESWSSMLGDFPLPPPARENMSQWLNVIDGWAMATAGALGALRLSALEQLLLTEAKIGKIVCEDTPCETAPEPPHAPEKYPLLMLGKERSRQIKLGWWDRFQTADGAAATLARLAVAAAIVATFVAVSHSVGRSSVFVHNGLAREIQVQIGSHGATLPASSSREIEIGNDSRYSVRSTTTDGETIESFDADASSEATRYVYNIANGSPLLEWTAVYGSYGKQPDHQLGAPRWIASEADCIFEKPPKSITSDTGGGMRRVLTGFGDGFPVYVLSMLSSDADKRTVAWSHARWDQTSSKYILDWISLARRYPDGSALLTERLKQHPRDPVLLRVEMDSAKPADRAAICDKDRALAAASPDNLDLRYVAIRCIESQDERDQAFINTYRSAPQNGWLAMAAGFVFAEATQWQEARQAWEQARRASPVTARIVAMDLARVRRMTATTADVSLNDLFEYDDSLRVFVEMDFGTGGESETSRAYLQLAQAHPDQAVDILRQTSNKTESVLRILRLAAASENASPSVIESTKLLPGTDGIDVDSMWSAYALALREHFPAGPIEKAVKDYPDPGVPAVLKFITSVQSGEMKNAEPLLKGVTPHLRGHAFSMAVILLGDRCPVNWRETAKRLLFVGERPYFR